MGIDVLLSDLVVVDQFNIAGIAVLKAEDNTPVGADRYGPKTLHVALERMKMKAGHPHVLDGAGFVELVQDGANLVEEIGPNSARVIPVEEPLEALMPKPDDHNSTVARCASRINNDPIR
jgi:hypothetical protein